MHPETLFLYNHFTFLNKLLLLHKQFKILFRISGFCHLEPNSASNKLISSVVIVTINSYQHNSFQLCYVAHLIKSSTTLRIFSRENPAFTPIGGRTL